MGRRVLTTILAVLCLGAAPTSAAPLQKNVVSPTADWVAHIDLEAFRGSEIGRLVLSELQNQGIDRKLQSVTTLLAFDPLRDIRDVTLYGKGQDRDHAVVVIAGQFDPEKLVAVVRLDPQYQEIPYRDAVLHRWHQEPKKGQEQAGVQMMYGCICDGGRIVMSSGLPSVQQAVDVLKGKTTGSSANLLGQLPEGRDGVFAQVAATGVGELLGEDPKAALLRQTESLGLIVGATTSTVFGELSLQGQSPEVADNMAKVLQGLAAMTQLGGDEMRQLAELTKNLSITRVDRTTRARLEAGTQTVFQFLKEKWEQENRKQGSQPPAAKP